MLGFNESNTGQTVHVAPGDFFEIALAENPSTGFRWKVEWDGAPVCTREGDTFQPGAGVGAPGTHRWTFHAAQAGECDIKMTLGRSWEKGSGAAKKFALRVVVGN